MSTNYFVYAEIKVIDKINMKVNLHSLRHTFATRCIESGMQAKVLQHILGHKDITTTLNINYPHTSDNLNAKAA